MSARERADLSVRGDIRMSARGSGRLVFKRKSRLVSKREEHRLVSKKERERAELSAKGGRCRHVNTKESELIVCMWRGGIFVRKRESRLVSKRGGQACLQERKQTCRKDGMVDLAARKKEQDLSVKGKGRLVSKRV